MASKCVENLLFETPVFSCQCMHVGPELAGLMDSIASSLHASFSSTFLLLPKSAPCSSSPSVSWIPEVIMHGMHATATIRFYKGPTVSEELEELSVPPDSSPVEPSASSCDPACKYFFSCMHACMSARVNSWEVHASQTENIPHLCVSWHMRSPWPHRVYSKHA